MQTVRQILSFTALSLLLGGLVACQERQNEAAAPFATAERPNILLIVVDDMGMSDLGSFGGEIPTPNLDRLALDGVRLVNFHASPVCSVTRAMLLTGVDSHKAGLGNMSEELSPNQTGQPGYEGHLNDQVLSISTLLREEGYHTYLSGKWHLGMTEETSPWARGFDRSFTLLSGGASHFQDMWPAYHPDPDGKAPYRQDQDLLTELPSNFEYSSQFFVDQMIEYLERDQSSEQPFFAYLAFTAPHWPLQAPDHIIEKYRGRYDRGYDVLLEKRFQRQVELGIVPANAAINAPPPKYVPWNELSEEDKAVSARSMEIYAAMIEEIDTHTGRLLDYLEARGDLENTIVIFLSDNGAEGHDLDETWSPVLFPEIRGNINERHDFSFENMGRPQSYVLYGPNWARAGAPALRLHKGFPTEGGVRVPAFVHYAGFQQSRISSEFMSVKDIVPTILDLLEVTHPAANGAMPGVAEPTGQSQLDYLKNDQDPGTPERLLVGEVMGKYYVRKGNWKIVHMPPPYGVDGWQLYDLSVDLAETNDLSNERSDILNALIEEWKIYVEANDVILPDWVSGY